MARRLRLNLLAPAAVGLVLCVVALAVANSGRARLHWLLGSASLVWIVLLSVALGWLLGLATGTVLRWRTRAPRSAKGTP
jgi:NhaP-type Na+/H+ or K+/H+ antiporter